MAREFVLGTVNGERVLFDYEARKRSTYVVGIQGTGKTTQLLRLAVHDMQQGHGVCIISPHGDLIEDFLARVPNGSANRVIVFDPSEMKRPFGFNLFACADPNDDLLVSRIALDVVFKTFELLWKDSWGAQMEQVLRIGCQTITRCQGMPPEERPTLIDFSPLLRNVAFRQRYLDYMRRDFPNQTAPLLDWWDWYEARKPDERADMIRSTLNKTDKFAEQPTLANIFGQPTNSLDLRQIMDEGRILLVDLSKGRLGLESSNLLGAVLVGQFYLAALSRSGQLRPFHLIVDEFQNFANDAFFELHEEARKYGVDTVIAHQNLSQIPQNMQDRALGAGNKIVFKVSGKDAQRLAGEFDATPPPPEVSTQRPQHDLSATPWTELRRGGGQSGEVARLVATISQNFEDIAPRDRWKPHDLIDYPLYANDVERALNMYLRGRMDATISGGIGWTAIEFWDFVPRHIPKHSYGSYKGFSFHLGQMHIDLLYLAGWAGGAIVPLTEYHRKQYRTVNEATLRYNYFRQSILRHEPVERLLAYIEWVETQRLTTTKKANWPVEKKRYLAQLKQNAGTAFRQELETIDGWYAHVLTIGAENETLLKPILRLGDILAESPIYSPSVYLEMVYEKPRTFDDVRNEAGNALKQQPPYHAWVVTADGREYRNVETWKPTQKEQNWQQCAENIRKQSLAQYGRDRTTVEQMIMARRSSGRARGDNLIPLR